ncbi:hypothetical protein B0H19DRAFT_1068448 [Mycena capillaripes]|nr:hypothetical protein B0H19DRAFT_1068448 [Mycena capillaripes]
MHDSPSDLRMWAGAGEYQRRHTMSEARRMVVVWEEKDVERRVTAVTLIHEIENSTDPSRVVPRHLKACIPCVGAGLLAWLSRLQPLASRLEVTRRFKTLQVI